MINMAATNEVTTIYAEAAPAVALGNFYEPPVGSAQANIQALGYCFCLGERGGPDYVGQTTKSKLLKAYDLEGRECVLKFSARGAAFDPKAKESVGLWVAAAAGSNYIVPTEALIVASSEGSLEIVTKERDRSTVQGRIVATQLPYIENVGTLGSILQRANKKSKTLTEKTIYRLAFQILAGIAAFHEVGGVHRDLKPNNILITTEKNCKVIDFDLAMVFDSCNIRAEHTGSPSYMAPEALLSEEGKWQISDERKIDSFSFGIILYEMMTGRLPWKTKQDIFSLMNEYVEKFETFPSSKWILDCPGLCKDDGTSKYGENLSNLLVALTNPNPVSRISIEEAKGFLQEMIVQFIVDEQKG